MKPIDFFKLQAKNLHKDYKTQTSYFDPEVNDYRYKYNPKYFDINDLFLNFDSDEKNFSLMKAQHLIAKLAGFKKWTDLSKASSEELELAKLVFDNRHKVRVQITSLPLKDKDRGESIEAAKRAFETVMWRMEPEHPELTRSLWNPELYIDEVLLSEDMLPIDRDYALSLIDAFLVHHVLDLAVQADHTATR